MKKIFVLSIQHTGTFFASYMISSAYPIKSQLRIGSIYEQHQKLGHQRITETNPIELSDFIKPSRQVTESWFDQAVTTVLTPSQIHGKEIIVGHEHHHKAKSWLIKSLHDFPAQTPIIIPVRDPLLSLHSKLWREDEQHNNPKGASKELRANRLNSWIARYKEILSIPKGNVFIFPIDAEQSKTEEGRLQLVEEMFKYCDVPFNDSAQDAAKTWIPDNKTAELIKRTKGIIPKPKWENFKERYNNGDRQHTRKFMAFEFDRLNKEEELKELMKQAGYKNVLWW